ncbi:hypothetical protein MWU60_04590 [Yoonia sp. F2084L]|uniref:hypothetical protein n=1 Tax=Yoonia sp. F2084L TaxID=2926419 RepID=UPI001FF56863|nr:hypothetical protein [Yoonia sp. F2084L]MCK0094835.1 hypothetical protein [Yoonia sp. F2084L]
MNRPLIIAACLMVLTTAIHVFAGGPEYHVIYQDVLPTAHLASMAAVLWHAVTINLLLLAAALFWLARHPNPALSVAVCAMQLGWAGLFLFYGIGMLGSPWAMPQWVIFLAIPLLTFYGTTRPRTA